MQAGDYRMALAGVGSNLLRGRLRGVVKRNGSAAIGIE
jgi:hypothetical protein